MGRIRRRTYGQPGGPTLRYCFSWRPAGCAAAFNYGYGNREKAARRETSLGIPGQHTGESPRSRARHDPDLGLRGPHTAGRQSDGRPSEMNS